MKRHLMIADGNLYNVSAPGWFSKRPLRTNYSRYHHNIKTVADFKATLRAGPYAWPGGYPLFFVTSDGGTLSFGSAQAEARQIIAALRSGHRSGGWHVCAANINWDDNELRCDHSSELIESAYED